MEVCMELTNAAADTPAAAAASEAKSSPLSSGQATSENVRDSTFDDDLLRIDPASAQRLSNARKGLAGENPVELAYLDLNAILDPQALEEKALVFYHNAKPRLAWAEWIRNVLILVPIVLTWYGLFMAADAYGAAIASEPGLVAQPFLLLWQNGFPGLAPALWRPTFSEVAKWDFIILGIVVLLTIYVHRYRDQGQDSAERKAAAFRLQAEEEVWQLSRQLAALRAVQSQAALVTKLGSSMDDFLEGTKSLKGTITDYSERLSQLDKSQNTLVDNLDATADKLNGFSDRLQDRVSDMLKYGNLVTGTGEALAGSVKDFAGRVDRLRDTEGELLEKMALIAGLSKVVERAGQDLDRTATTLRDGNAQQNKDLQSSLGALNTAAGELREGTKALSDADSTLNGALSELPRRLEALTGKLDASAKAAQEASDRLRADLQQVGTDFLQGAEKTARTI